MTDALQRFRELAAAENKAFRRSCGYVPKPENYERGLNSTYHKERVSKMVERRAAVRSLMAESISTEQIADRVGASVSTVKSDIALIRKGQC